MKPALLLHICCAPDEAWVVHTLHKEYTLHCFFCNPNIAPESEYLLRCNEAENVAAQYHVPFTAGAYDPDSWELLIAPVAATPEGGERCRRCFDLRLERTARFCAESNISSFTTVMSISPHKRIALLNEAGERAARQYNVNYQPFDFKKHDGFRQSILLSRELGLYRQDYCGCRISRDERDERWQKRLLSQRESDVSTGFSPVPPLRME